MSSNSEEKKKKKATPTAMEAGEDEVEEMLKAAQDEISLKLAINSHMSRVAPSYLDSDLNSRFQSLKKPNSKPSKTANPKSLSLSSTTKATQSTTTTTTADDHDDLLARFAALKGSLHHPSPSSSSSASVLPGKGSDRGDPLGKDDNGEEDEVERILQWAIDAARLDPSPLTDDDEAEINGTDDDDDDDDEDDSDDEDYRSKRKKGKKK